MHNWASHGADAFRYMVQAYVDLSGEQKTKFESFEIDLDSMFS